MAVHKIGNQSFAYMFGEIPVIHDEVELLRTPGEDGHIRRRVGRRSPTFQLRCQNVFTSQVTARNAYDAYADMILGPVNSNIPDVGWNLVKDDINYSTGLNPYQVSVMGVTLDELKRKALIAGYSGKWFLQVTFSLVLIPGG